MPDLDPIADALPAGSSPAADSPLVEAADALDRLSATELHDWRMTGALPDPKVATPPAASSAAPAVEDPPASTDAPPQAASEPADPEYKAKTKARIDDLLARANRAESRARELEQRHAPPTVDARPAASSPAPAGPTAPDPETFPYGTSDPAYLTALAAHTVQTTLAAERARWDETQQHARAREESQRVIHAFEQKAAAARTTHADFDAVALLAPTEIPPGSAADLWVLEDEAGAEILYHLQQPTHAAERRRILALGPREQLKELVRLGDRLTAPDPAARSTSAPPPPPTLSTRATPADPVERALRDDDTAAYHAAMNARDLARLKGK